MDDGGGEGGPAGRRRGRNLTREMERRLRERIIGGPLRPGQRLPTEKALAEEFGVSRTVVREAIAALRADGLVEPRQGVGMFVTAPPAEPAAEAGGLLRLLGRAGDDPVAALDALELRMAVEIHAAGLAAARRSWSQDARIRSCIEAMDRAVEAGEGAEDLDLALHRAIAEATNNACFPAFLDLLGSRAIPRRIVRDVQGGSLISPQYMQKVQEEHRQIAEAISAQDAAAARRAMEVHLAGSRARYGRLLASSRELPAKMYDD